MARKKISLTYIPNDATRRATLKKRRRGLLKKVSELSVLCGVKACAMVFSPGVEQPEAFPSKEEARVVLASLGSMPEMEKSRKMVDQKSFLEQRLQKLSQQVHRLQHGNRELSAALLLRQCLDGSPLHMLSGEDFESLLGLLDRKAKAVQVRLHQLGAMTPPSPPQLLLGPPPAVAVDSLEWVATEACDREAANDKVFAILTEQKDTKSEWEGFFAPWMM